MQHDKSARPDANSTTTYADKFKAGFRQCATEATQFLVHVDPNTSTHMLHHLSGCIKHMDQMPGSAAAAPPQLAGVMPQNAQQNRMISPNYAQSVGSMDSGEDLYDEDDMYDESSPPQAAAAAAAVPISAQVAPIVKAVAAQLQREQQQHLQMQQQLQHHQHQQQQQQHQQQIRDMHHRINTPPQSPDIDIDDEDNMPVWRPW